MFRDDVGCLFRPIPERSRGDGCFIESCLLLSGIVGDFVDATIACDDVGVRFAHSNPRGCYEDVAIRIL